MKMMRNVITVVLLMAVNLLPAQTLAPDSVVTIDVLELDDSLEFKLTSSLVETQLTFLMQGLDICVIQPDTITLSFPSAAMVRNKVKRHPNEVKAVLASRQRQQAGQDSINHVVRPDVQPLVAALNDTTATYSYQGQKFETRNFKIDVDREKTIMSFSIRVEKSKIQTVEGKVDLQIASIPLINKGDRPEFVGKRLSGENAPHPNGLGEGIRKEDVAKRTFQRKASVVVSKVNVEK